MDTHLVELDEVGSTNDWLMEHGGELPSGSWVMARIQTGGRGRRGRPWRSPPGNVYASTLTMLQSSDPPATQLAFVASLALAEALAGWVPEDRLLIKWPNDVLLDDRKLAGILLERQQTRLVTGFGVNLASHPLDVERPAISLAAVGIDPPPPMVFVERLSGTYSAWLKRWRRDGFAVLRAQWLKHAHPMETPLVARLTDGDEVSGAFDGLADDGALQLRLADGARRVIHTADVFAL